MRVGWWILGAGLLVLVVAYCGLEPERRAATSGKGDRAAADPAARGRGRERVLPMSDMDRSVRQPPNPAEQPGVEVYRPRKLENISVDRANRRIIDLDTGDRFSVGPPGHAGGPRSFGLISERPGVSASGFYNYWSDGDQIVFVVFSLYLPEDGHRRRRAREEYDISRVAELLRTRYAAFAAYPKETVIVVDSRAATMAEIDPETGNRKAEQ